MTAPGVFTPANSSGFTDTLPRDNSPVAIIAKNAVFFRRQGLLDSSVLLSSAPPWKQTFPCTDDVMAAMPTIRDMEAMKTLFIGQAREKLTLFRG